MKNRKKNLFSAHDTDGQKFMLFRWELYEP